MKIELAKQEKFAHVAYDIDTGVIHSVAANPHYLFDNWSGLTNEERKNFGVATIPNPQKEFKLYETKISEFILFR